MFKHGKNSGHSTGTTNPSYNAGKSAPSNGVKLTAAAGKSSGTKRSGDPQGAPAMSHAGKKD
jgi:hypothetical protein